MTARREPLPCWHELYLIAASEGGRRFVHDPPLRLDGEWILAA